MDVSEIINASSPSPSIPLDSKALLISEAVPVKEVPVEASIFPVVFSSRVLRRDALMDVSEIINASLPSPFIMVEE